LLGNDPDVRRLLQIAGIGSSPPQPSQSLWERRPADADFLALRLGLGSRPTSVVIKAPEPNLFRDTPALNEALDLARVFALVRDVPLTVSLPTRGSFAFAGPRERTLPIAFATLAQLIVHHSPAEVRLAAFWAEQPHNASDDWGWLRRLPHTAPLGASDDHRLLARYDARPEHLRQLLDELRRELQERTEQGFDPGRQPHIVVLLDSYHSHGADYALFTQIINGGRVLGMYAICLVQTSGQVPGACGAYVDLGQGCELVLAGPGGDYLTMTPDSADRQVMQALAQQGLEPIVMADSGGRRDIPHDVRLLDLFGIGNLDHYQPAQFWNHLPAKSWHAVPLGKMAAETPLELDLNQDLHGPHGMVAGTTGSGKSELLLTLLAALAVRHSPDRVNFMLIDFKGAATFNKLGPLPHTVGVVSDLEGYVAERALIAINSELDRRKKLLAEVRVSDIRDYREKGLDQRHRSLPNLLIAIDEFDELARDYPDFVAELVRVGKQGRSLGVQLLFVTQQPSAIKAGLTSNLSYRIALRLTTVDDSREVIGQPDAAYLTSETPGRGYFRVGKDVQLFQSALIRTPYRPPVPHRPPALDVTGRPEIRATLRANGTESGVALSSSEKAEEPTDLSELIKRMVAVHPSGYARERYPIWMPPLTAGLTLNTLLQWPGPAKAARGGPFALLDHPNQALQEPLCFYPGGQSGHLLVVGSSGSGKTTLLRSLVLALAFHYPPTHLWVYTVDAAGSGLGLSADVGGQQLRLPHSADALAFGQTARLERLVLELQRQIVQRRRHFAAHTVDSLADYKRLRATSSEPLPPPPPSILVVIDQVGDLVGLGGELVDGLKTVMRDGRAYGISVIISGLDRAQVGPYVALCETRIALRLNDVTDSDLIIGKSVAAKIRPDQPGRGFLRLGDQLAELQVALPTITDSLGSEEQHIQMQADSSVALRELQAKYTQLAGAIGLPQHLPSLPERIELVDLLSRTSMPPSGLRLPIAMDNATLDPVELDFGGATPHLLIAGSPRSGRAALLRTIVRGLAVRYSHDEVQFLLIDGTDQGLDSLATLAHARSIKVAPPSNSIVQNQTTQAAEVAITREQAEVKALIHALEHENQSRSMRRGAGNALHLLIIINSWDTLYSIDRQELNKLASLAQRGPERRIHFVVTMSSGRSPSDALLSVILAERCVAFLGVPQDNTLGLKVPRSLAVSEMPPGRGLLMIRGQTSLVQFASEPDAS